MCTFKIVCVHACVRAYNAREVRPGSQNLRISKKHRICILDARETQDILFFI